MIKVLTFYLCGNLLGIDVTLVKEINRNVCYTAVPGSKKHIAGLLNMRGQVVTLFDLAEFLTLKKDNLQYSNTRTCIILKTPRDPDQVGILIDRPGDVIDIDTAECEPPPANVGGVENEFISSVVKLKSELLIIIDPQKVFSDRGMLEA